MSPWDLSSRHYLITGAASGIGRAVAQHFSQIGAKVSLVDCDSEGLETTLRSCCGEGHRGFPFDLSQVDEVGALVAEVFAKQGALTGLVHCAGIQTVAPAKVLTPGIWRKIFSVNTESGLALAKAVQGKKVYAGAHGSIVFISSIMALAGSPGAIAYSMSKAALHGITRSLALELAPRRIRVNCIAPGFVLTPLFERTAQLWNDDQRKAVEALHPLGFGQPEDIANAAAYLCCDTGRWVTGSVLVVDGGYLAQ